MLRARRYAVIFLACLLAGLAVHESGRPLVNAASEYALQFDGVDDRVTFGTAPGLGAQNFTLELWFMRTGAGTTTSTGALLTAVPLLTKGRGEGDGSAVDMNYFLGIDQATRTLAADFEDRPAGGNHPVRGKTAICDNVWYHAAVTYDSGTAATGSTGTWRLYLNGELETELAVTGTLAQRTPRFDSIQHAGLGTAMTSTGVAQGFFKGQIDEARIWNVVRTQAEIKDTMDEPLLIAPGGLLGRWGLDEGTGTTVATSAGTTNGTLQPNAATIPPGTGPTFSLGGSGYATTPLPAGNNGLRLTGTTVAGDYVQLEPLNSTALGSATFTVETWFRRDGAGASITTGTSGHTLVIPLVTKGRGEAEGSNVDFNYFLGINAAAGGRPVLIADFEEGPGPNAGLNHPISGATDIANGTWYHGAVTYDGSNLQLYLNGQPDGAPVFVGRQPRFDSIMPAALGTGLGSTGTATGFFAGALDETRIWNYARTPAEMLANYRREVATATGLLGRWGFDERCGCIVDSTGRLANGSLFGTGWSWISTPSLTVNEAPIVSAGVDATMTYPGGLLTGTVTDDSADPAAVTTQWSKTSGPGVVSFSNPSLPSTNVTFSGIGTYVLTLTASDGTNTVADSVTIQVVAGTTNMPPTAIAGPDQAINMPAPATLSGIAGDDGLPGGVLVSTWSKISGPGTVTFADAQALTTTATFSTIGSYVLRLTVEDGEFNTSDDLVVTVNPTPSFAIDFNGTTAFVALGQAPGLGAQVFTLEAWIRRDGAGIATATGTGGITAIPIVTKGMAEGETTTQNMNYFLGIDSTTNTLAADFEDTAGGVNHPIRGNTAIPSDGQWHHVAATFGGGTWRLYLDGHEDGTASVGAFIPRNDSVQHAAIGSALGTGGVVPTGQTQGFFNGAIDEVRIWGVVRSADEIQDGMATENPIGSGLLGRWGFNEGTGVAGALVANSANPALPGTMRGTFAWVAGAPFASPNLAPGMPVLVAPANGATGVASPATLKVSVADADGDPLTVTYFGRPKGPAQPNFTLMTIPDTQHYSDDVARSATFTQQTNWIVDNVGPLNIQFVSHLGDIVENQDRVPAEWTRANQSMTVLDVNRVPYGVSPGNHDQTPDGTATNFDLIFPPSRFIGNPWYGGFLGAEVTDPLSRLNKDNFELFSAGGIDFVVIHIEHDWPGYAVSWADRIIKRYPNRKVILSTHLFLNESGVRPASSQFRGANGTSAEAVWNQIIRPNCNVFMVINGHYPGENRRTDLNSCGQPVHQIVMDYQSRSNGGDGWLRYFVFKPAENKIAAFTYSPKLGVFETDADSQFELDWNMGGAGYSVIATETNVASGSESSVSWAGLAPNAAYEWYATVSDGKKTTKGDVWSFTTEAPNAAPVALNDSYTVDEDNVLSVAAPGVLANDTDANGDALSAVLVSGPANGVLALNADGSFTYTPNGNFNGADSFTYKAADGIAQSNVATVAITVRSVNDAPVAVNDAFAVEEDMTLTVGPLGVLANDSDQDGASLKAVLAAGPSHGTVTLSDDGGFTYTPNRDFSGTDSFTYRASDGEDVSNVATVTIAVDAVNDAPVANDDSYSTDEDMPLNVPAPGVLGNDIDADGTLQAAVVSGPSHGTLALNADGSFTYVPNGDFNGADSFTYKATDSSTESNVATVSITVNAVNDAPVAANDSYATDEDVELNVPASGVLGNDTDVDGASLTAVLVSAPSHGTLSLNADGSFSYKPAADFSGGDTFTYRASDGGADSNVATVSITVNAVNDAPVAVNDSYSTDEDVELIVPASGVLGNDTDGEGASLKAVLAAGPSHGTVTLNEDGSFSYKPAADFSGADSFTYRASDGGAESNVATVSITVNAVNDAPVAVNDSYATDEDVELVVPANGVLGNDTDADGATLTAALVSGPSHGTLALNADGSFSYKPAADFNGADSFTYRASDGDTDSNVATVAITVNAVNDAPVAANDSYSTDEDVELVVPANGVLGNDTDADGTTLTAVLVSGPSHGTLALNADGSFSYKPAANFNGADSFTYRATDGGAESNVATVAITVKAVNDAPVAANDSYAADEDVELIVPANGVLGNDTDADGATLTAALVSGPSHGTLALNADGSFRYKPAANFNGADSFTYRATDGDADSNVATVAITVKAVNDAPVAADDSFTGNEDAPLVGSVLGNDTDADGTALQAILVTSASNGTLTLNADGSFTYLPNANFSGADAFTYKTSDGAAESNVARVSFVVNAVNDAPVAADDSYSTDEDVTLAVAAPGVLGNDSDADSSGLQAIVVSGPSHGTLALNGNGSFSYVPATGFNGADSFTYRVSDGVADSNTARVSITIRSVNDAPLATSQSVTAEMNRAVAITLRAQDTEGSALTYRIVTAPRNGTLSGTAPALSYTPKKNFLGADSFTFVANDGTADSNVATVSITVVKDINDAPVAFDQSVKVDEDERVEIELKAKDPDGKHALKFVIVSGPSRGKLSGSGSDVRYTPNADFHGQDSFTFKASDKVHESNVATVIITVKPVNDAPDAKDQKIRTRHGATVTGILEATDVDGDTLKYRLIESPREGKVTIDQATGRFTYTPDSSHRNNDDDRFTWVANDGKVNSDKARVTIDIEGRHDWDDWRDWWHDKRDWDWNEWSRWLNGLDRD